MINNIKIDGQEAIELELGRNRVVIVRTLGGTVCSLKLGGKEILFNDKMDELTVNSLFRGRILFPFNDRIPEGKYKFKGQNLQFPLNCDGKDSIHGLIYNRPMNIISSSSMEELKTLELETTIKEGEFKGYPFDITITIKYTLTNKDFTMDFRIYNPGEKDSPFAIGWHPYFSFGKIINSASLKFESNEYFAVNKDLYYEGNHYTVNGTDLDFTDGKIIGERDLDIAISLKNQGSFILSDNEETIFADFSRDLFPNLQLFIPEDRMSLAVEPISAPSDTFNYPDTGLVILKPKETKKGWITISYKA